MRFEQRFFRQFFRAASLFLQVGLVAACLAAIPLGAAERTVIADGKISIEVPDGFAPTDRNAGDTLAGYATQDGRSSFFFRAMDAGSGGSMRQLLDATVANFEERFRVTQVEEPGTGQVDGPGGRKWPAVFTTAEATVTKGGESFDMKFYLLIFDTGDGLYPE